jgi:hypothetical protein
MPFSAALLFSPNVADGLDAFGNSRVGSSSTFALDFVATGWKPKSGVGREVIARLRAPRRALQLADYPDCSVAGTFVCPANGTVALT